MKQPEINCSYDELRAAITLQPHPRNPNTHSDEQIKLLAKIIQHQGWRNPVVVSKLSGFIVAGHGRLKAAELLGLDEVPVDLQDFKTEADELAHLVADNRIAELSEINRATLADIIADLDTGEIDLELTGFELPDLEELMTAEHPGQGLTDDDEVPEPPEQPVTVEGDIWLLGDHRLMCGDSTSVDAVEKLMDGHKADMVFTDPPYNVAFNGRSGKHDVIMNDKLSDENFETLISGTIETIKKLSPDVYYIWCNWNFYGILQGRLNYKSCIVWAKNCFGMGNGYRHQHEFCLFNGKIDEAIKNESDLWSVKKDHNYVHPTQKPVELSVRAFGNHIKLYNIVDLFGGSGSTLIGAEQTRRKAFLMELDPKYCDVIINRWQDFTGKEATHADTGKKFETH